MLCSDCHAQLNWIVEPVCFCCGRIVPHPTERCVICQTRPLPLKQIRAAVLFTEPVTKVIHKMKYEGLFGLADPLANLMVEAWSNWHMPVDLVTPIPLHPDRKRKRGYNQSDLLAKQFSTHLNLKYDANILKRNRNTIPQVGLNAAERLTNVEKAFDVTDNSNNIGGKHILLIDDVCTTGATMTSAARALLTAGAQTVSGYCVARAM
ncbi:MAG: ComF family protein [Chloroflexi bacterium]|nr:ComF family protein [Chloroflexota bacterium]